MSPRATALEVSKKSLQTIALATIAIPSAALALFVHTFGVNVIVSDEWIMVPLYEKMLNGSLSATDLFAPYTAQRMFFPRLAMLVLERLSSFNVVWEMYLSWALLTATVTIVFYMYLNKNCRIDMAALVYFLPVSLLMFSFRQEGSILWGFGCQIYFPTFCVVAATFFLDKAREHARFLALSVAAGVVASFSFLLGLAVWPMGFLQIVLSVDGSVERRVKMASLWVLSGAMVSGLYLRGLGFNSAVVSQSLRRNAEYFLAYVGGPFTFQIAYYSASIAIVLGIIATVVFFQALKVRAVRENSVWISLIVFSVLSGLVTTFGRAGLGVEEALSSGYTPVSVLAAVGLYLFAVSVSKRWNGPVSRFAVHALLTLILLALVVSTGAGWHVAQQTRTQREIGINVLQNYRTQSDAAIFAYVSQNTSAVREWAPYLQSNRLNVFATKTQNDTFQLSIVDWRMPNTPNSISVRKAYWLVLVRTDRGFWIPLKLQQHA